MSAFALPGGAAPLPSPAPVEALRATLREAHDARGARAAALWAALRSGALPQTPETTREIARLVREQGRIAAALKALDPNPEVNQRSRQ